MGQYSSSFRWGKGGVIQLGEAKLPVIGHVETLLPLGKDVADLYAAIVTEVNPQGLGHGPELFRVGQVGADQLCQTVYGIRCLCQLVPGVKLQIPPLAAAHGIDEDHGKALGGGLRGAETTGLGEHQVRCIHIGGDILGEAQDPEIGPVAQLQKALVKLFVVAADDDEHAILRQHFRQAAGQTLDGAAAHASAHEKGHPLVRRDAEGRPGFPNGCRV